MTPFSYQRAESIADGLRHLSASRAGRARLLAGGTDLLPLMKSNIEHPDVLVGIRRLAELSQDIVLDSRGAQLGARVSLAQIAQHEGLREKYTALAQAAQQAASPQLRNMATLGGTLLQRPRCWYFRDAAFKCWLKGGSDCNARTGLNQAHAVFDTGVCRAAHPSDLACALHALDASVELQGRDGSRRIAIRDFMRPPTQERRHETLLAPDEMVIAVYMPSDAASGASVFLKAMDRNAWSFATVSVAARMRMQAGRVQDLRVFLGAVATVPWSVSERLATLRDSVPDDERIASAVRQALEDADPLSMNAYKVPLAKALLDRALRQLAFGHIA